MEYVPDRTGRFAQRPHFEPEELDYECEEVVSSFLRAKYGSVIYPIATNDLTILVEREVSVLDVYADLTSEGERVQGVTDFLPGKKPRVRIARELSEEEWRENRLRTTLTHELGHVKFHNFLWDGAIRQLSLSSELRGDHSPKCKREDIIGASPIDWMEWQAGYACGAFLMPISNLKKVVSQFVRAANCFAPLDRSSTDAANLIERVTTAFQVSAEAATIRLAKLGYIGSQAPQSPLLPI